MKEFEKRAKELGVMVYHPCEEMDHAFLKLWAFLIQENELETVMSRKMRALSRFMDSFQPPTFTLFCVDEKDDIWLATWFDAFADAESGVFMHAWVRADKRGTRDQYRVMHLVYDFATTAWPVVVGVTKHEHLLRIHRKMGYNIVGHIPAMLDGEGVWVLYLTRELFQNSKFYQVGVT